MPKSCSVHCSCTLVLDVESGDTLFARDTKRSNMNLSQGPDIADIRVRRRSAVHDHSGNGQNASSSLGSSSAVSHDNKRTRWDVGGGSCRSPERTIESALSSPSFTSSSSNTYGASRSEPGAASRPADANTDNTAPVLGNVSGEEVVTLPTEVSREQFHDQCASGWQQGPLEREGSDSEEGRCMLPLDVS